MSVSIRRVADDQWELLSWLWQAYRSDLATVVHGLPYADGRPGAWTIAFQHENAEAAPFWRRVATELFGPESPAWTEERRPVPGKPDVPPDHWIETRT